jgi:hypothetical protein
VDLRVDIKLEINNYFPELPGYSTEYEIKMMCGSEERKADEYTLKAAPNDLKIENNIVTATDGQKRTYDNFIITAIDKLTGEKAQITITPKKWRLNFEDHFPGSSLNPEIWSPFEYKNSREIVKDGVLKIFAERLEMPDRVKYTTSGIRTHKRLSQKYGCFMARMKSPDRGGCNSAFWLMPEGTYTKDAFFMDGERTNMGCSEIDIVEYSAFYENKFPITMHYWDRDTGEHFSRLYWVETADKIYKDYHDYACVWEPDGIYYYIDGKPVVANRNIFTHEDAVDAYIVLSTNSAKLHDDLEWLGPCTDDMFPFETSFEWVKAYR